MKIESGGGGVAADGEQIEVLALPIERITDFVLDASIPKSTGMMYALIWMKEKLAAK